MKIAIVTWTNYSNYGTYLQSYALQKYIENLGFENYILSDRIIVKETSDKKKILLEENKNQIKNGIGNRIINLMMRPKRFSRVLLARINREKYEAVYSDSRRAFEAFRENDLKIIEVDSIEELDSLNNEFDIFICGSDQIWSVVDNVFNSYYYLDFVTKKKVAYAPSLGTDKIPKSKIDKIKILLSDFSAISVREEKTAEQLSALTGKDVKCVADPTLLFDRKFWCQFVNRTSQKKGNYMLCYFLENKPWYFQYAEKLAKKMRLKIVLVPNRYEYISSEYVAKNSIGPRDFVSLIEHAAYILTDSYHGSIFSLIFGKKFRYLLRFDYDDPNSQNIRIQSLFERLNINDRIITKTDCEKPDSFIDYKKINELLEIYRKESRQYLIKALDI